jgi:hypothetical protein
MSTEAKTAPEDYVYDLDTPRRPTEDDVDPYSLDVTPAPLPRQLYANQMNQRGRCIVGIARVSPVAIITIDFASGAPFVAALTCCSEVVEIADLTVTDNGNGDTTITWAANTFPIAAAEPDAHVLTDGAWLHPVATAVTNGFRVKTRDSAGTLTNVRTKVNLY